MKALLFFSLFSFVASAAIIKRPEYVPDENHPAPQRKVQITPRQAEEERPQSQRDEWNEKRMEREREERLFKNVKKIK